MSRETAYLELFAMLDLMTVANGFSRDYTVVKSVDNSSATQKQTPYISLHFGVETPVTEGVGMFEYRALVPVTVTARIRTSSATHKDRREIEYAEDIERSKCIKDIKKNFTPLAINNNTTVCIQAPYESYEEEDAREDSNKHDMFVKFTFGIIYKQKF
jgi:hypothetical protein